MLIRLIVCAVIILGAGPSFAATRYVDSTIAATCAGSTYSIAARNCSGSDGTGYKTVEEGLRALVASDQLYIRAGSYTISGTYGNISTDDYGGGASSWATATTISNYVGEVVTITVGGFNFDETITANTKYIIWHGDSRENFIVQGAASGVGGGVGFRTVNGANHIRIQTMTVRNFGQDCLGGGGSPAVNNIEAIDNEISGCGDLTNLEHGIYWSNVTDSLIEGNYCHGVQGYCFHLYNSVAGNARITVRGNRIGGRKSGATGTAYGMVFVGADHVAYNNIISGLDGESVKYVGCFQAWTSYTTGLKIVNNTCYDVTIGIENNSGVTGAEYKNNIFNTLTNVISDSGSGTVLGTNLCPAAGTGCSVTGSPSFTNAAVGDFSLQSSSPARDAGATLAEVSDDYIGTARPQNSVFDIGAYEYIVSSGGGAGGMSETPSWSSPRRNPLFVR